MKVAWKGFGTTCNAGICERLGFRTPVDKGETSGSEFIHSVIERYHDCLWSGVITYLAGINFALIWIGWKRMKLLGHVVQLHWCKPMRMTWLNLCDPVLHSLMHYTANCILYLMPHSLTP